MNAPGRIDKSPTARQVAAAIRRSPGTGLVFLVAHANFRLFKLLRVEHLVLLLLPMHAALVIYELVLLSL